MAYGIKYRCEWTDIQSIDWRVEILEDDYAGAISAMIASGEPLTIDYLTPGDDLTLGPIKGSMATLNVECTTNFEYIGLYSEEDLVRPMNVYKNEVLYWSGWLSNEYTEPYDNVPYTVSITASDALGLLKNIEYKDSGVAYTGRDTETDIILEILAKIGHTQFTEYCNLYEDRMDDGVANSPFDQAYIDNDLFTDADCYSVLQAILIKYNAVIRQKGGTFIIYRPTELVQDTVYGRIITAASTTGTSITPDKIIDREGLALIDVEGGVLMYKPPMTTFTAQQDYGNRESWIKNHNFSIDTWQGYLAGNARFTYWTNACPVSPVSHFDRMRKETDGIMLSNLGLSLGVTQSFGTNAKACSDAMVFSCDYLLVNLSAAAINNVSVVISISDDTGTYYLDADGSETDATWTTTLYQTVGVTVATAEVGMGAWQSMLFNFVGLPVDGPYTIRMLGSSEEDIALCYRNVRFYSTSDSIATNTRKVSRWKKWVNLIPPFGIIRFFGGGYRNERDVDITDNEEIVERNYTVDNGVQGEEGKQTYILGDVEDTGIVNVLEQFRGALALSITGGLTQAAVDFVNAQGSYYTAGGVVVTSSGNKVVFTSSVAGTNFTGSTTITNASGDLAGSVATTRANQTGQPQIETLTLTGASGSCNILAAGQTWPLDFTTTLTLTAAQFVTDYADQFEGEGIEVTSSDEDIIFTEITYGDGFTAPTIVNVSANLDGTVAHTQAGLADIARIDEVTLTGTSGTANILCDGVTRLATFNTDTVVAFTSSWHTRDNAEALPLAELIAEEVADMYSEGRQFIQLNLYELTESLDLLKNLQDPLNLDAGHNRVFAINRGSLDCKMREWTIDMIEIGDKWA